MSKYDKLIELINIKANGSIVVTNDNVSFGLPVPETNIDYNTKIVVTALPELGYTGDMTFYYTRIDLAEIGNGCIWVLSEEPCDHQYVVETLNDTRDTFLLVEDLDIPNMPTMRKGDTFTLPISALNDSVNWIGNNDVNILIGLLDVVEQAKQLFHTDLPKTGYLDNT